MFDEPDRPNFGNIKISQKEMNELKEYLEMNDFQVFEKGAKLLFDILQSEKLGWKFGFMKVKEPEEYETVDDNDVVFDENYHPNVIVMGLPRVAELDIRVNYNAFEELRINKSSNKNYDRDYFDWDEDEDDLE